MKIILLLALLALVAGNPVVDSRFDADTDVYLRLFTRENPSEDQILITGNYDNLLESNFDISKPLKVICHGYGPNWKNENLIEAFLALDDVNVISVDWTAGTSSSEEALVVSYVPSVGRIVANYIDWLSTLGLQFSDVHIVGMSLGSHVAAHAGRYCENGVVEYITGCDPPKRIWQDIGGQMSPSDGKYVEAIHTSTLVHSFTEPIATADFYPNGGETQAGCDLDDGCDHRRSMELFIESIGNENFGAMKCNDYDEMHSGECADLERSYMGGTGAAKNITGVYYLDTNGESPYAQGRYFNPNKDVNLRLFTRSNPEESQIVNPGDYSGILLSNFDFTKPLKFYAHGWGSGWYTAALVEAWLTDADVNVIFVDWTAASNTQDEALMVSRVPSVGQYVASFIDWVTTYGITFEQIHVVGMSIGSHTAGHIARYTQNGEVEYVTGCDPPKRYWEDIGGNININDGKYVEIIHTSSAQSLNDPIGDSDFYPNGGGVQPGCEISGCSHIRCLDLFIESIGNENFGAMKCNSYEEMQNNECADLERSYMGGTIPKNISGVYYLDTKAESPYAQGRYFNPNKDVNLRLFTRSNPEESQIVNPGDYSGILLSNFDFTKPLKFYAHGWGSGWYTAALVEAWLTDADVNVIFVDWTAASNTQDEALMVSRVPSVGQYVASFIDWVTTYGITFEQIHVVGMSIGSHTAGHIARYTQNGEVEYVTGCDPPKRYWEDIGGNININDGKYVEIIHTSSAQSLNDPIGDSDFYPNGGGVQPGCEISGCSHIRCLDFFIESIGNENFAAMKCNSYEEMQNNECADLERSYMGGTIPKNITGVYYLTTNAESPYAQGPITKKTFQ